MLSDSAVGLQSGSDLAPKPIIDTMRNGQKSSSLSSILFHSKQNLHCWKALWSKDKVESCCLMSAS